MRERIVRPSESFRMDAYRRGLRPNGRLHIDVWQRGKLLYSLDRKNLVVNSIITPLSKLLGGDVANQSASVIGFGSGTVLPSVSDTGLTNPAYYKALDGHTYPSPGSVQFQWSIQPTDYGAVGIAVCEFGLFANTGSSSLPSAQGVTFPSWAAATPYAVGTTIKDSNGNIQVSTALPTWQAGHSYRLGDIILDSNGHIQRVTTAGTSGGSHPAWATTPVGATTTDNTVTWTLDVIGATGTSAGSAPTWPVTVGATVIDNDVLWTLSSLAAAPSLTLFSRVVLNNGGTPEPITITTGMLLQGTWTETF